MKFHSVNHRKSGSEERSTYNRNEIASIRINVWQNSAFAKTITSLIVLGVISLALLCMQWTFPAYTLVSRIVCGSVFFCWMVLIWKKPGKVRKARSTHLHKNKPVYYMMANNGSIHSFYGRKGRYGSKRRRKHNPMRDSKRRSGHAVVRSHNKFLLLRKNYGNPKRWHCPGGMAKHNEHRIDAAVRETYEETGCKVVPVKQLRKSDNANYYLCNKVGGHATKKSHEIREIKWFSLDEVKELHQKKLLTNCNIAWFELLEDEKRCETL